MRLSRAAVGAAVSVLPADAAWAQSPGPAPQPDAGLRPHFQAPLRNPVELNAPAPPVRLQPNLQGPPLQPQTDPGAVVQVQIGAVGVTGAEALAPPQLAPVSPASPAATSRSPGSRKPGWRSCGPTGMPVIPSPRSTPG